MKFEIGRDELERDVLRAVAGFLRKTSKTGHRVYRRLPVGNIIIAMKPEWQRVISSIVSLAYQGNEVALANFAVCIRARAVGFAPSCTGDDDGFIYVGMDFEREEPHWVALWQPQEVRTFWDKFPGLQLPNTLCYAEVQVNGKKRSLESSPRPVAVA